MDILVHTASPSWQPITLSITFESEEEVKAYLDVIGDTSDSSRFKGLQAAQCKVASGITNEQINTVSNMLSRMWDVLNAETDND